ncbi:MAG: hypothetical protein ACKOU6_11795 [Planctomycetota bacterium]
MQKSSTPPQWSARGPGGFPLGALFVLTAVCAVIASHLLPIYETLRTGKINPPQVLLTSLLGGVITMILGGLLGIMQPRPGRGAIIGVVIGFFVGAILLPAALLPATGVTNYWVVSLTGSFLIVLTGAIFRAR